MIKVELNYNPYLLETSVKFNGQTPRINSLVEKFQDGSLQKWVRKIPDIFYDEMNGFDFELEFSGTKRDFEEVVDAFQRKGVTSDMVHIFHKNELNDRYEKSKLIGNLMKWFEENKNRNFNFDAFKEECAELIHDSYVYIIFQGNQLSTDSVEDKNVSVEHVATVDEIKDTDLRNTPILMYLSKENVQTFHKNLLYFLSREDVESNQLFFLVHPSLDETKVERTIKDLGIDEPMLVSEVFDANVKRYLELYPVSNYIHSVVSVLKRLVNELSISLQDESEKCAIVNKELHECIDQHEEDLCRLKDAYQKFVNRDNIEIPMEWNNIETELWDSISTWRKRKTKITDDQEASREADDFENDVKRYFENFIEKMINAANITKQDIDVNFEVWYKAAEFDENFQIIANEYSVPEFLEEISIADELKKMYEEEYVQPKEDIFSLFFKTPSDQPVEQVLQRTYYYQNWRDYVLGVVQIKVQKIVKELFECIQEYEEKASESYIVHIANLIDEQTQLKNQESAKLSDEEKLLQNDMDWLVNVQDQLRRIERG